MLSNSVLVLALVVKEAWSDQVSYRRPDSKMMMEARKMCDQGDFALHQMCSLLVVNTDAIITNCHNDQVAQTE